ncbi:MAG: hypothetical protein ACI87J_002165 [Colwellia sp.]
MVICNSNDYSCVTTIVCKVLQQLISRKISEIGEYTLCIYIITSYLQPRIGVIGIESDSALLNNIYGVIIGSTFAILSVYIGKVISVNKYSRRLLLGSK